MPTKVEVETNTEVLIDIWNQIIGPKRVNLEVKHAQEALLSRAKEKCESVLHLLLKLSHTDVLKQLAYIHAALLEGMARTRLRIYRESWRKQGHVETSESLDAIWEYDLVLVFDWCRENLERLLKTQMMWDKVPMPNLVRTGMGFFDEKANEFKKRLQEEVEIAKPFQRQAAKTEKVQVEVSASPPMLSPVATAEPKLPKPIREGASCVKVVDEIKRIKNMYNNGMSMEEIKKAWPNYEVWKIVEGLSEEDREVFEKPARWEAATGYAKLVLSKFYGNSPDTITEWVKAYKKHEKLKQQKK